MVCIINVFVNIQVCIVQRYNADNSEERPSVNVFKAFLETSHFFMTEGCKKLAEKVKHHLESCEDMKVPLGELFSMSHLLDCVLEFRASMEDVIQSDVHQDTPNSISETYEEYVSSVRTASMSLFFFFSGHFLTFASFAFYSSFSPQMSLRLPILFLLQMSLSSRRW